MSLLKMKHESNSLEVFGDNTVVFVQSGDYIHIGYSKGSNELINPITIPNNIDGNPGLPETIHLETYINLGKDFKAISIYSLNPESLLKYLIQKDDLINTRIITDYLIRLADELDDNNDEKTFCYIDYIIDRLVEELD